MSTGTIKTPLFSGLATTWLRWELQQAGVTIVEPDSADVALVSLSSQQGLPDVRSKLRALRRHARIVIGGGAGYAPAVFDDYVDAVCVGEGRTFVRTLAADGLDAALALPNSWVPGQTRQVIPDAEVPWDCPPMSHPDGTIRLLAARGCRSRCLFCQTGWESDYRVHPQPKALADWARHLRQQGHKIALLLNDGGDPAIPHVPGQEFVSAKLCELQAMLDKGLSRDKVKTVRIGVEGVSEQLRRAVGKPIHNAELFDVTEVSNPTGHLTMARPRKQID